MVFASSYMCVTRARLGVDTCAAFGLDAISNRVDPDVMAARELKLLVKSKESEANSD